MEEDISKQLAEIATATREKLFELWRQLYRKEPPLGMRREILVAFLSYRLQETIYGGLSKTVRAQLLKIGEDLERSKAAGRQDGSLRTGTRLIRQWQGQNYEVLVTAAGYEYGGEKFPSLSAIARRITGTRWSGPAFFGIRNARQSGKAHG